MTPKPICIEDEIFLIPKFNKMWIKEKLKTGISKKEWWDLNKDRDTYQEFRNKAYIAISILFLIKLVFSILISKNNPQ